MAASIPAAAWNETGHKAVAYIAYQNLTPSARARVDALLARHPHYGRWGSRPFLDAAYWPDVIRRDPQYHHGEWHYINIPFSPDGTPLPPLNWEAPSVLTKIREFRRSVADPALPEPERAVQLAWLLHLVGDVHQPLHAVARFTRTLPEGDRGGNGVHVRGSRNLHAFWDERLGIASTPQFIRRLAVSLMKEGPPEKPPNLDERRWVEESFQIAKEKVYTFGNENGTAKAPLVLPDAYRLEARRVARARAALAGYRLAALLNQAFGGDR